MQGKEVQRYNLERIDAITISPIHEGEFLEGDKAVREMTDGKLTRMSEEHLHLDLYLGKESWRNAQPNTKQK